LTWLKVMMGFVFCRTNAYKLNPQSVRGREGTGDDGAWSRKIPRLSKAEAEGGKGRKKK